MDDVVEMEASALYMLGAFRGVEVVSVFVVGDSIADEEWEPHFQEQRIRNTLIQTARDLLHFLDGRINPASQQQGSQPARHSI